MAMAGPRLAHESVLCGNKLLVWGGELIDGKVKKMLPKQEIFSFDIVSKQWSQTTAKMIASAGHDEPTPCALAQTVVINNTTAYSFGGYYNKDNKFVCIDEFLSLDCEKMVYRKLSVTGDKPIARDSYGLCAVDEKFLIMHGGAITDPSQLPLGVLYKQCDPKYGCIDDCWVFSPPEGLWTRLHICGHSPSPRCGHSLTATDNAQFVLYGGFDGKWLSDMYILSYMYEGSVRLCCLYQLY